MNSYLESVKKQFTYYKFLGDQTFEQIADEKLFWKPNQECNSIATLVKHLNGNMLSRWTNFLTTDGEKANRNREKEFEEDLKTRTSLMLLWNQGWECLFKAIDTLTEGDLEKVIYIRNMGHTVQEAINRQLAHYPYHIGQIVFLGKLIQKDNWKSLSIPKGNSEVYNRVKFSKPKRKQHFTDDL